jgi:hypothetical protein
MDPTVLLLLLAIVFIAGVMIGYGISDRSCQRNDVSEPENNAWIFTGVESHPGLGEFSRAIRGRCSSMGGSGPAHPNSTRSV